jgi:amidohydrolase
MKEKLYSVVDRLAPKLIDISDQIFDKPELAFEEVFASKLLCDALQEEGFKVEYGLGSLKTAFRAVYKSGEGGPNIGLLAEYDALPMGHACGHQMQGPAIIGAAVALKETLRDIPYNLIVYGTPGEEGGAGKLIMLNEGYIKELDVALMMHGGPATQVDVKSMAMKSIDVSFKGKSAHAALKPDQGRSAFDALLLTFQGVEFLREHVLEDTRMHYTVLDAGGPANVVPAYAKGSFYLRSYNSKYLESVNDRFYNIVKGAALMTDTEYEIVNDPLMNRESKVPVHSLNKIIMDNAKAVDAPNRKSAREKTGSTDFGDVTYVLPGACLRMAFVPDGTSSHSQAYLDAGKTEAAHKAIVYSAKILAATAYDLIAEPEKLYEVKKEFKETLANMSKV